MLNKGFTLLELMAGAFVLMVGVAGVVGLISRFMSYDLYLTPKMKAIYLSQEGIEIVRNMRDSNWVNDRDWDYELMCCSENSCLCEADYETDHGSEDWSEITTLKTLKVQGSGLYSYDPAGDDTKFKRTIELTHQGSSMDVCVTTQWGLGANENFKVCGKLHDWYIESLQ